MHFPAKGSWKGVRWRMLFYLVEPVKVLGEKSLFHTMQFECVDAAIIYKTNFWQVTVFWVFF